MNYTQEEINLITLCSFDKLLYSHRFALLSYLSSATPDFVKYEKSLIKSLSYGVYNKVRAEFSDPDYRKYVLSELEKRGISCLTYFSDKYPEKLKATPTPPIVLYLKGNAELLNNDCLAVVGSRRTLPNMLKECRKTSAELTQYFTVVTGMADGADTAAIEGALSSGKIISVLAYGFDYAYPAMNKQLIEKVAQKGLLVTEYTPTTKPQKHLFPVRNRIIAALSNGALIVSAGAKSGALITAGYAAEYGREVFAFPYGIGAGTGEGCNWLIRNYGTLVRNTADILEQFGLQASPQKKIELSPEEEEVLAAIRGLGTGSVTELADKLKTQPYKLIPAISKLEIKGLVARLGGNRYNAI